MCFCHSQRDGIFGEPHEIIVVDDASSDATALIARQQGAQVIRVEHRQIAATRNAGARQAHGDILFFVDADTLVNAPAIQSALRSVRAGAVGGGCVPRFEGRLPWWRLTEPFGIGRRCAWPALFAERGLPVLHARRLRDGGRFQRELLRGWKRWCLSPLSSVRDGLSFYGRDGGHFRAQAPRAFFPEPGTVVHAFGSSRFPRASEPSRIGVLV